VYVYLANSHTQKALTVSIAVEMVWCVWGSSHILPCTNEQN